MQQGSAFVVVEYCARDTGDAPIANYEIYFQLLTMGPPHFEEVTDLGVGQDSVAAVRVGGVFVDGQ